MNTEHEVAGENQSEREVTMGILLMTVSALGSVACLTRSLTHKNEITLLSIGWNGVALVMWLLVIWMRAFA